MPISPNDCLSPVKDTDFFVLFCELVDRKLREEFTGSPLQLVRMNYPGTPSYDFSKRVIAAYNAEQWNVLLVEEGAISYFHFSPMLTTKINNETILAKMCC